MKVVPETGPSPEQLLQFLALVSHEIRTPLGGLLGLLSVLNLEEDADRQKDIIGLAQANGEHLRLLLDDLVDLARLRRDDFELAPQSFEPVPLIRDVTDFWAVAAAAEGKSISLSCPSTPAYITADPLRFRQIFDNLISNALKYSGTDLVRVQIECSKAQFTLNVITPGRPLAPDFVETLFQDFVRAPETAGLQPGAGLGLKISRQLARLMGGDVGYRPAETGNCFWVKMPIAPYIAASATASLAMDNPKLGARLQALVVDDVLTNRLVMTHYLGQLQFDVIQAANGTEALDLLCRDGADIVFLDQSLPDMDGKETARRIRQLDGPVAHIPIIGISGYQRKSDLEEMRRAGMTGFAPKPVTLARLTDAVRDAQAGLAFGEVNSCA